MKKRFLFYLIAWVIVLAVFNAVVFVTPALPNMEKYSTSFWIGYVFVTVSLLAQLGISAAVLNQSDNEKLFLKLSITKISVTSLIVNGLVGAVCMIFSNLLWWVAAVVSVVVLGFEAIAVLKATVAVDAVSEIGDKVKAGTQFIRLLTADAQTLIAVAKSDATKTACTKVYETVRYSDPMSNPELSVVEARITVAMDDFSRAVNADDTVSAADLAEKLTALFAERNNKCKALK